MVTLERPAFYNAERISDYCCLSTDTKPTSNTAGFNLKNGDRLYEIDTSKKYKYSSVSDSWVEQVPTGVDTNAVHYTQDSGKTEGQKSQARDNIGVTSIIEDINQRIDDISAIGRFLAYWNSATGLPLTNPTTLPYQYHTGDYFVVSNVSTGNINHAIVIAGTASQYGIHEGTYSVSFTITNQTVTQYTTISSIADVLGEEGVTATGVLHTTDAGDIDIVKVIGWEQDGEKVVALLDSTNQKVALTQTTSDTLTDTLSGGVNYKPSGTTYTGSASTAVESNSVQAQDIYRFDGTNWVLAQNTNPDLSGYVPVFQRSFTDSQKTQARVNISASAFIDEYIADANTFLTVGFTKTNTGTANLPNTGYEQDRWGSLIYLAENTTENTGYQIWGCVAYVGSNYRGTVWVRAIVQGVPTNWKKLTTIEDIEDNAVLYNVAQSLTEIQKTQARTNIGAGTYSKPADGIPKTDLASGVQTSLGLADSALQSHQSLSAYRTASAQDVIDAGKQDAPIIKIILDSVLVAGVQYYLGLQSSLTLTLPTTGLSAGQMIEVVFYSNTTAATLNIVGDFLGSAPTIFANTKAELNFLYDGTGWSLLSLITALTTYNITATVTNATASSSNPTKMNDLYSATLTFTFDGTSYTCPTTAPTITGATGTWTKNSDTQGTLVLSDPTGAVSFTVEGVAV